MIIYVKYEDTKNEYTFGIDMLIKELGLDKKVVKQAILNILERT